jgi:HSP20 family molecular chaperone IbpA
VNPDEVVATSADGVLSISLAKKPESKPRQIEVRVAAEAPKQVEAKV